MKPQDNLKKFLVEFFKDCKIENKGKSLIVKKVPKDFEKFIGKNAPYTFVFDLNTHKRIPNSELVMNGGYFLSAIRDYLEHKGQTSLLKINFNKNQIKKKLGSKEITTGDQLVLYDFTFLSISPSGFPATECPMWNSARNCFPNITSAWFRDRLLEKKILYA